jgi:hypothetical protein
LAPIHRAVESNNLSETRLQDIERLCTKAPET